MLIDLHSHTWPRSYDSIISPDDLIERAKLAGLDAICFTEHDAVWDEMDLREISEKHNFLVLPGVEISTDDGHMLTYGIDRYVFGMHHASQLAAHVSEREGAIVGAHPYRRQLPWKVQDGEEYERALQRAARNPAYQYVIGLEVLNGRGNETENGFSRRLAENMNLPGTAGTDSHALHDVGTCATYFERQIHDVRDLIAELKAGRFHAVDLRQAAVSS